MENKLSALYEMYNYALTHNLCKNKSGFSKLIEVANSNLSRAFSGDPRYLTDKFIRRTNEALGGVFNEAWLLYGEGAMFVSGDTPANYGNDTVTTRQREEEIAAAPASTIDMLLAELKAQRESSDNQISRLLAIIENMTNQHK